MLSLPNGSQFKIFLSYNIHIALGDVLVCFVCSLFDMHL